MLRRHHPARIALTAAMLALGCATDPTAVRQAPPEPAFATGDLPVTSVVADADATVAPALQVRSDGLGAYLNSRTLISVVQAIGAWVLDTKNPRNSTRQVFLEFSQPIAGTGPGGGAPVAVPSALYKVHLISKCNLYGNSMLSLAPGQSVLCPLHVAFDYAGAAYAIQMNPLSSAGESYPDTHPATVTCVAAGGGGSCTMWRITPTGQFTGPDGTIWSGNTGRLLKYVTSKGSTTAVSQGSFRFSFSFTVSNP